MAWFRRKSAGGSGGGGSRYDGPDVRHYGAALPYSGDAEPGLPVATFTPQLVERVRLANYGLVSLSSLYRYQPAVRICVDFLSYNQAHTKLKAYDRGAGDDDTPTPLGRNEPLARLLAQPNDRTTGFELIRGTSADIAIYDTAYWWIAEKGNATQLFRVPPHMMQPRGGDVLTGPAAYDLMSLQGPITLLPEQVVDFSGYDPTDTRVGAPILESLRNVLAEDYAASEHRKGFWKNAARRDGVIERPADAPEWDDTGREVFRESWQAAHSGANNAGKTPILEDGMKWNPDSFSPRDSEFIKGREWTLDMVATAMGIPLAMISRTQTPTFASMKEFHKVLYVDVLGPRNARIESVVNTQLVPRFGPDLFVEFFIEEKLQGDFETQADAIRSAVQVPWMAVNTALRLRNMAPIGDPEDPNNPYNIPARPTAYEYGAPGSTTPAPGPMPVVQQAALNGHEERILADLATSLEERDGRT